MQPPPKTDKPQNKHNLSEYYSQRLFFSPEKYQTYRSDSSYFLPNTDSYELREIADNSIQLILGQPARNPKFLSESSGK